MQCFPVMPCAVACSKQQERGPRGGGGLRAHSSQVIRSLRALVNAVVLGASGVRQPELWLRVVVGTRGLIGPYTPTNKATRVIRAATRRRSVDGPPHRRTIRTATCSAPLDDRVCPVHQPRQISVSRWLHQLLRRLSVLHGQLAALVEGRTHMMMAEGDGYVKLLPSNHVQNHLGVYPGRSENCKRARYALETL